MVRTEGLSTYGLSVLSTVTSPRAFSLFSSIRRPRQRWEVTGRVEKVDASTVTADNRRGDQGEDDPSPRQINTAYEDISAMSVPFTDKTTAKVQASDRFRGKRMVYNKPSDTMTNTATGTFAGQEGCPRPRQRGRLAQSLKQNVDWPTTSRLFTEGNSFSQFKVCMDHHLSPCLVLLTFVFGFFLMLTPR